MIVLRDVTKVYRMGAIAVHALRGISFAIADGEFVAIMGPSGSGKSTTMNILGCLDSPTSGSYQLDGLEVAGLGEDALAGVRNRTLGFVFQSFNLLPRLSALEQVELPLVYARVPDRRRQARAALEAVGLGDRMQHTPTELSGGQQQRVAIARALVTRPRLILADEPTGNLDTQASAEILALFHDLHAQGITVVFVTHEPDIAAHTHRVLLVRDGALAADERRGPAGWPPTSVVVRGVSGHGQPVVEEVPTEHVRRAPGAGVAAGPAVAMAEAAGDGRVARNGSIPAPGALPAVRVEVPAERRAGEGDEP